MTERLAHLLQVEADRLDVPPPADAAVLAQGRGLRRRRRAATVVAGLAVVAVVGGGAVMATSLGGDGSTASDPAAGGAEPDGTGAVFAAGTTVYLDGGAVQARIDDAAVKSLYYTSAGVLVRHGDNPDSDGGGPQRFSLVAADGTVSPVSVVTEEVVPGTDATQPYLAYAVVTDGVVEVVVHDLRDDTEVARVPVPGAEQWGGWTAPPVTLAGDLVYVGTYDVQRVVDWRTGQVSETRAVEPGFQDVVDGRTVTGDETSTSVVEVASGDTLISKEIPPESYDYFDLSPDGRYATVRIEDSNGGGYSFEVYSVDSGEHVTIDGSSSDFGWTGAGNLFAVDDGEVTTCSSSSGACTTESLEVGPGELRLGGRTYES